MKCFISRHVKNQIKNRANSIASNTKKKTQKLHRSYYCFFHIHFIVTLFFVFDLSFSIIIFDKNRFVQCQNQQWCRKWRRSKFHIFFNFTISRLYSKSNQHVFSKRITNLDFESSYCQKIVFIYEDCRVKWWFFEFAKRASSNSRNAKLHLKTFTKLHRVHWSIHYFDIIYVRMLRKNKNQKKNDALQKFAYEIMNQINVVRDTNIWSRVYKMTIDLSWFNFVSKDIKINMNEKLNEWSNALKIIESQLESEKNKIDVEMWRLKNLRINFVMMNRQLMIFIMSRQLHFKINKIYEIMRNLNLRAAKFSLFDELRNVIDVEIEIKKFHECYR